MKLLLIILIILAFSLTAFGQTPAIKSPSAEENWQTFAPAWDEFSIEVPELPATRNFNFSTDNLTANRAYRIFNNGIYYFMFSDVLKTSAQHNMVFGFAGHSADSKVENVIFKFADKIGFYHRILTLRTPTRVYTFQTVSENENSPQLDRFFGGIKIGGKASQLKEMMTKTDQEVSLKGIRNDEDITQGTDREFNSGSRVGLKTEANKAQTTPLTLLAKPRPSYTDYARLYQIVGIVRMRVTFSADGTIGTITPTMKLPFGLTEEAIAAAKRITFNPQVKNGKSETVAKLVEYNFVLF